MTERRKFRGTGPNAKSGLTLAELIGVPDVPEATAVQLFTQGADLGDAAKLRWMERHKQDLHSERARLASLAKSEQEAERRSIALRIAQELRKKHPHTTVGELSKMAHKHMAERVKGTDIKPITARGFENLIPPRKRL